VLDSVIETHLPMLIRKNRKSSVVVMPLEDYHALTEIKYLLSSPANSVRLMQGISEVEALIAK
jgi:PHD/YefM family antitoxin component YafN of YafNO toxin-antitoxin module